MSTETKTHDKTRLAELAKAITKADNDLKMAQQGLELAQKAKSDAIRDMAFEIAPAKSFSYGGVEQIVAQRGELYFLRSPNTKKSTVVDIA